MDDSNPNAELRLLQERAFGPNPDIDAAGLARLNQLEAPNSVPSEDVSAPLQSMPGTDATSEPAREDASVDVVRAARPVGAGLSRRRLFLGVAFAVSTVVAIVGAGWAGFVVGHDAAGATQPATLLPPGVESAEAMVSQVAKWDSGSLALIGKLNDATIWAATKDSGHQTCVVLHVEGRGPASCDTTDAVRKSGISGSLVEFSEDGTPVVRFSYSANPYAYPQVTFTTD